MILGKEQKPTCASYSPFLPPTRPQAQRSSPSGVLTLTRALALAAAPTTTTTTTSVTPLLTDAGDAGPQKHSSPDLYTLRRKPEIFSPAPRVNNTIRGGSLLQWGRMGTAEMTRGGVEMRMWSSSSGCGAAGWRLRSRRGEMVAGKALERESKGAGRGWRRGRGCFRWRGEIFKTRLRWLTPSSRIPVYPGVRANKRIDFQFCQKDSTLTLSEPTRFADYI